MWGPESFWPPSRDNGDAESVKKVANEKFLCLTRLYVLADRFQDLQTADAIRGLAELKCIWSMLKLFYPHAIASLVNRELMLTSGFSLLRDGSSQSYHPQKSHHPPASASR